MLFGLYTLFSFLWVTILSGLFALLSKGFIGSKKSEGKIKWELYEKNIFIYIKYFYFLVFGVLTWFIDWKPLNWGFSCNEGFFIEFIFIYFFH
jgi:hypothetical protein